MRKPRIWPLIFVLLLRFQAAGYWIAVSNERAGSIALVDSDTRRVVETIQVGRRPRGIHPSPDGKLIFVALSGTAIAGPPKLDTEGNPVFQREDPAHSDHAADGHRSGGWINARGYV
jgi:YVTN family beta-propeller protein